MEEQAMKSQCLIKMKTGDQILVEVDGRVGFEELSKDLLSSESGWCIKDMFAVRLTEVIGVYFFPEGYEKGCGSAAKA